MLTGLTSLNIINGLTFPNGSLTNINFNNSGTSGIAWGSGGVGTFTFTLGGSGNKLDFGATTANKWTSAAGFNINGTLSQFGASAGTPAHIASGQTTAPAATTCNQGGGAPSIVGTDTVGELTTGTLATSCVITFNVAYTSAPFCTVTWQASLAAEGYTVTNAALTITQTATTGNKINYNCIGRSGG